MSTYDDWKAREPAPQATPRPRMAPLLVCRCGTTGTEFFWTGILSRQPVCDGCGRLEEREHMRRLTDRPAVEVA